MAPHRTMTKDQDIISISGPAVRTYDFSHAREDEHAVRVTVPKGSEYRGEPLHWHEQYIEVLKCIEGRAHAYWGTGLYSSVDAFFPAGTSETIPGWAVHYWGRDDQWQTAEKQNEVKGWRRRIAPLSSQDAQQNEHAAPPSYRSHSSPDDLEKQDVHSAPISTTQGQSTTTDPDRDKPLTVSISPSPNYWDQRHSAAHELLHRHVASLTLDATLYPSLPTTPLPIRLLFSLPWFLFPRAVRAYLIAWFLSIQLLVLYSADPLDFHPYLGTVPVVWWWTWRGLFVFRAPEWAARWQWNNMIVVSHMKVAFWARVGKWVLGMKEVYEEYTPERLGDVLRDYDGVVGKNLEPKA